MDKEVFASWEFGVKRYLSPRGDLEDVLRDYRQQMKFSHSDVTKAKQKLIEPMVNPRTGKPLSPAGITKRRNELVYWQKQRLNMKQAIRFLHDKGYLDKNSKRYIYRDEVRKKIKLKALLLATQELKAIEDHLLEVLAGRCELDKFRVWKSIDPVYYRITGYLDSHYGLNLRPDKMPWPELTQPGNRTWEKWQMGRVF
jgi:hypothetical protein